MAPEAPLALPEELALSGVRPLLQLFSQGKASPLEATEAALARIRRHDGKIGAFVHLDEEGALAAARASEERWRAGTPLGLLDGVPLSIKDNLHVEGQPTRQGSLALDATPQPEDSSAAAAVRRHGAVILGKTSMPEMGLGPVTISPLSGVTRNPRNLAMNAGGSSGGAAAAVAAGMGNVAIGSDAGGSIRIPAAFTGLVGFKPSYGRVPGYPFTGMPFVSCAGPLSQSVADAALMMNVLAEPDRRDPQALPPDGVDYVQALRGELRGLRIAFSPTLGYARKVDPEVAASVAAAAAGFADLGATVEEADPGFQSPISIALALMTAAVAHRMRRLRPEQQALLGERLVAAVKGGAAATAVDYLEAMDERLRLACHMQKFHETYDLLITPTVSVPAFAAERWTPEGFEQPGEERAWTPFTSPFNLTQQPAVSLPCGLTGDGLPIGLHIVGRYRQDSLVLAAAHAFEQSRPPLPLRLDLE